MNGFSDSLTSDQCNNASVNNAGVSCNGDNSVSSSSMSIGLCLKICQTDFSYKYALLTGYKTLDYSCYLK